MFAHAFLEVSRTRVAGTPLRLCVLKLRKPCLAVSLQNESKATQGNSAPKREREPTFCPFFACVHFAPELLSRSKLRAVLKGTNLRGQTPICNFLRVPAVFCEHLRFSVKIRVSQCFVFQEKARISKNLQVCVWARFVPLGLGPLGAP